MAADVCFIFFANTGQWNLESAAAILAERNLQVERKTDELVVSYEGGPALRIALASGDYVRVKAASLSAGTPHAAAMSRCDTRYEIMLDDLDAVLDEINTLIEVQTTLQDMTQGILFCAWNGEFLGGEA